ncbi:MAG TPA: ADOP family duplicated permease [Candidatus Sulfotelmatobacter sp.]|nr:ADOP family duplicated permease [Candidatus Sulfotelmatobacter sp.]
MNFAHKMYRRMAEAFPHEFKLAYGTEVLQLGDDVVDDIAKRQGVSGLARLMADIAIRVPIEYLSEMRRDMRYAARALIKSPGFALVGIISMALAIGLTIFVYGAELQSIFRDLPGVANANDLVMTVQPVSYYSVEQYRAEKDLVAGAAAIKNQVPFNVSLRGDTNAKPQRVFGQLVSPDYFSVLGMKPQSGRLLSAQLDRPGDAPVVVISDRFWRNRLNASSDAIGQAIRVNGQSATIIGVTPKDFNGAGSEEVSEIFVPTTVPAALAPELGNDVLQQHNAKEFLAILRMAPGVSIESAESGVDTITRRVEQQDAPSAARPDKGRRATLMPAGTLEPTPPELRHAAIGFFAALMGLIVTIASMNLSNMLLARAANRRKELAIRLSVGASRFRLIRQMISEGMLLSLLGGVAGFALAYWLVALSSQLNAPTGGSLGNLVLDWHAAILSFCLAIACGVALSVVPAMRATKADLTPALKEGSALQLPGYRRVGLRNLLMVTQVAGSLMLLLMTGFLVIGIDKISTVHTKFDANKMFLLSIDPVRDGYTPEKTQALFEKLPERLKNIGDVQNVALAAQGPYSIAHANVQLMAQDSRTQREVAQETVGAGYFAVLNEPILSGREFTDADQRIQSDGSKTLPVLLNQSAAQLFFGNGNAVGKRLAEDNQSYEVVGVVHDLNNGFGRTRSEIYLPLTQRYFAQPSAAGMTIIVRSVVAGDVLNSVEREIASIDPHLTIFNAQTLNEYLDSTRAILRFAVRTYSGIGIFGLILAAIGLAGVTAYAVAQRQKEIGIRTAVGASKLQVLRLVLREGAALIAVGTVLGLLGAVGLVKALAAMASFLVDAFRVGTSYPPLLIGAPLLLATLAMLACYLPARRAAQIDPLKALREE